MIRRCGSIFTNRPRRTGGTGMAARIVNNVRSRMRLVNLATCVAQGDRRQVFGNEGARPPAALTWFSKSVAVPTGTDKFWRSIGKWVAREQAKNSWFGFE